MRSGIREIIVIDIPWILCYNFNVKSDKFRHDFAYCYYDLGKLVIVMQNTNKQSEIVIDVEKLFFALLRKLPIILIVTVLMGAIGFGYSKFLLPLQYKSSVYMYVQSGSKSDDKTSISQGEIQAAQSLVSTYIVILKNNVVLREVAQHLQEDFTNAQISECFSIKSDGQISLSELKNCLTMQPEGDTEVLRIAALTNDPEISAAICNIYAEIAPAYLIRIVGAGNVEVIGAADVPTSPSAPNITKIAFLFAVIGFVLTAGIIVLHFLLDRTIKDEDDLSVYSAPYLGDIPEITLENAKKRKNKKRTLQGTEGILLDDSLPFYVKESYRSLRTNLMFALSTKEHNSVVISSANPSEGKSKTSSNLAITLGMMDAKVILIDGDMRRPVQHQNFALKNENGLSEVLSNMKSLETCIHRNVTTNLDVLCSGACPPNPAELLASATMQNLLKKLESEYDYIIIDAPPINLVSDALGIAPYTAGMMLITKYRSTKHDDIEKALQNLKLTSSKVLGIVINRKEHQTAGYGYGYKKYGYGGYGYGGYGSYAKADSERQAAKQETNTAKPKSEHNSKKKKSRK